MIKHEDQINQFISEYNDKNHQNLKAKYEKVVICRLLQSGPGIRDFRTC